VFQGSLSRDAAVIGVREDGANHFLGIATLPQNRRAACRMFCSGTVGVIRPALVIEIMQKRGDAPKIFVGAGLAGIGADAGLDGQGVFAQAFVLRVLTQESPGVVSRWQSSH
jgi:hypothetical protein